MIIKKIKDALTETTVKIHGTPFFHRLTENKFAAVETWVRKDGHGTILKNGDDKFVARYEKWNDVTRQYDTRITEPFDEIEDVVDLMDEDINEGEYKKKTYESDCKELIEDAGYKPEGKAVWVIREDEDFWRPWGVRNWTEEELEAFRDEFKKKGWKDVMLVENDGTDPNKVQDTKIHDDFGYEIPDNKAWNAYESVLKLIGPEKLLQDMRDMMPKDKFEELMNAAAAEWDMADVDVDEFIAYVGEDEALDTLMQYLPFGEMADYLAALCKTDNLKIPELVDEEEVEVEVDDALWARPDNSAGTAGRLANKSPIKYNGYLIMTRTDGKFDVYTGNTFSLVGTEYKTVEEAKKNIDEGRGQKVAAKGNEKDFEEDDEEIEVDEDVIDEDTPKIKVKGVDPKTAKNPNAKRVNYAGFNFTQRQDGTWTLKAGGIRAGKFKELLTGATFGEAVNWLFDNMNVKVPDGNTRDEQIILEFLSDDKKRR